MPRPKRVSSPHAIHYCWATAFGGSALVVDEHDRAALSALLRDVALDCGWKVFAWALTTGRYHLVFQTPAPNLIEGMRQIQNTWTKRYNARHPQHRLSFEGRYKSALVQEGEYAGKMISYVHLAPLREKEVSTAEGVAAYPWSSLRDYLVETPGAGTWVDAPLGCRHLLDGGAVTCGGPEYLYYLEMVAAVHGGVPAVPRGEHLSLTDLLRKGCVGSPEFRAAVCSPAVAAII